MYSIIFYKSFGVKIWRYFPGLFISRHTKLNCSKPSIGWTYIERFIQQFSILWLWPSSQSSKFCFFRIFLLKLYFWLIQSYQQYVLRHKFNISVHLKSYSKDQNLSFVFFVSVAAPSRKNFVFLLAVKVSIQFLKRIAFHSSCFLGRITSRKFAPDRVKERESVSISSCVCLSTSENVSKKL